MPENNLLLNAPGNDTYDTNAIYFLYDGLS
jgi:hypothetical protein